MLNFTKKSRQGAILCGSYTDRGAHRPENQDAVFCRVFSAKNKKNPPNVPLVLCAVCDGVGGMERGDLASGVVTAEMARFADSLDSWVEPGTTENGILFSHFRDAAEGWNATLCDTAKNYGIRTGTTFSGFLLNGDTYQIIHAGDSRIYRYRPGDPAGLRLLCLTEDECVWREQNGRMRSFLSNCMGIHPVLSFCAYGGTLLPGDMLLACSDGFYHHLTEHDAQGLWKSAVSGEDIPAALSRAAQNMIARGETDNLSAVLYLHRPNDTPPQKDTGVEEDAEKTVLGI